MSQVKFYRGLLSSLPSVGEEGAFYLAENIEEGKFILYYSNGGAPVVVNKDPSIEELKVLLGLGELAYLDDITSAKITDFSEAVANVKVKSAEAADAATKATQDGNGDVIVDTYAKKATTLAGYGIADAYTTTQVDEKVKGATDLANEKVASVAAGDSSVSIGGTSTAPTVAVKLSDDADNAITLTEKGIKTVIPAADVYSIVKSENSGEFAAIYKLTKNGSVVEGAESINIPKDMVVESGSVVENPEGQPEGTYIELKLQNVTDPLYINVGDLIEYVTSGSATGDMIVVNVSDDHKVTATITDGTITLAKLTTEVQTAIGKAHTHDNKAVIDGISAEKVAAWDAAEDNAKRYADSKVEWGSF